MSDDIFIKIIKMHMYNQINYKITNKIFSAINCQNYNTIRIEDEIRNFLNSQKYT